MKLSIIIPTLNSATYIKQTLEHLLHSTLLQTYLLEIIVVDDGSTDQTGEEVLKLAASQAKSINYIKNKKNLGQKACLHIGLNYCKGTYALTFDDDLQYTDVEIDLIYQQIVHSSHWVIGSKSKYTSSLKYHFVKKAIFLMLQVFFQKYIEAGYFSSFKIYNWEILQKNSISNVFLFWKLPTNKLGVIELEKKKGLRTYSNYNFINFVKLTSTVIIRIVFLCLICGLIPAALAVVMLKNSFSFLVTSLSILASIQVVLEIEKRKYAKLLRR